MKLSLARPGTPMAAALMLCFALSPFIWQIITALKPAEDLARIPPLLPSPPTMSHFINVVNAPGFMRIVMNSLAVASLTVMLAFFVGIPAAYALGKLQVRGRQVLLALLLCLSMFPAIANVGPLYLLFIRIGIRDNLLGVVLAHSVFALPFSVWTMTNFFQEIPDEIYRAARIDGCSHLGMLRHVVLPLAAPGLVSVGLLVFIFSWNEFLYAFTLTASERSRTLPVAIALFPGLHEVPWGEIAAAGVLATVPTVLLVVLFQRRIVSGLTAGAIKG